MDAPDQTMGGLQNSQPENSGYSGESVDGNFGKCPLRLAATRFHATARRWRAWLIRSLEFPSWLSTGRPRGLDWYADTVQDVARNAVQFQKGLSFSQILRRYDTEEQCGVDFIEGSLA